MSEENTNSFKANQNPTDDEIIEGEIVDEGEGGAENNGGAERNGDAVMAEEYNQLAGELQQAQNKAKEFFEGWQRERADFSNYKRRVDREQQTLAQNLKVDVIKKYLGVLDDLERAMKARPTEGPAASWAEGIDLIVRKLQQILESEGVRPIQAEGEQFDPTHHEAITHEESPNHESGQVIEVLQQGYTLGDRVIRPALVRVAR